MRALQTALAISAILFAACVDAPLPSYRHGVARVASEVQDLRADRDRSLVVMRQPMPYPRMAPAAAKTEVPRHIEIAKKAALAKKPAAIAEVIPGEDLFFVPAPEPREDIYDLPEIYNPATTWMTPTRTPFVPPHEPSPDGVLPSTGSAFPTAALTVGGVSLAVATVSAGIASDDPTDGAIIFSGVMAGVSIAAFAVGGIVYLMEAGDEGTRVGVGPGSFIVDGSF